MVFLFTMVFNFIYSIQCSIDSKTIAFFVILSCFTTNVVLSNSMIAFWIENKFYFFISSCYGSFLCSVQYKDINDKLMEYWFWKFDLINNLKTIPTQWNCWYVQCPLDNTSNMEFNVFPVNSSLLNFLSNCHIAFSVSCHIKKKNFFS